jgi:subtilisin family serine protease
LIRFMRAFFILVLSVAVGATSTMAAYADSRSTYIVMPNEGSANEVRTLITSLGEYPEAQLALVDDLFIIDLLPEDAAVLAQSPAVAFIEQDAPVVTAGTQNPTPSWGLDRVDGTLDGSYGFPDQSGEGVIAYVFDTGVAADHPDLVGRVAQGFDAFGANQANKDCHYHGTHVAGTIAGTEYGVAKKASVVPLRVLDCGGSGSISGVMRAINWTIANHPAGTPAVANFSLGGGRSNGFNAAIATLVESGITTVVAAGNERTDACTRSPASTIEAITVGATDRFDTRSSFSNFGECVDIFAPGSAIVSADARNYTRPVALSGTSMAAPHVAGVAALILGQSPTALPEQVEVALFQLSQPGIVNNSQTLRGNRLSNVPGPTWTPIPTIPGAPTGLVSTQTGRGFAEFSWDEVPGVTGYQVEFRKGSQNAFSFAAAATNKFRVEGLSGGEMAYIRVRAVVAGATTKFSATVGARSSVEVSSEPRNLTLDATSKNGMVLTWATPSYLGGASNLTYRVEMKTTGDWYAINSGPSNTLRISDMRTPHQFRVFAINEAGTSASSAEVTFDPALVYAVQTLSATIESGSNANLSWQSDAPAGTNFEVVLTRATGAPAPITYTVQGSEYRLTGLTRMTGYRVTVTPVGSIRGLQANTTFATAAVAPGAPRIVSNSRQESGWVLTFGAPADNGGVVITSYRLEQLVAGAWTTSQTSSSTIFTVPLPARGTFQDYRLVATNSVGDSVPSSLIRIATPAVRPAAPQSFSAELLPDGKVQMGWGAPLDDGGSAVSSYRVEVLRNGVWSQALSQRGTTNSALIAPKGVSVSYRVSAFNAVGLSLPSPAVEVFRAATAPSSVGSLNATLTNGVVRLAWFAPVDDGGSPALGYRVEQRFGSDWATIADGLMTSSFSMQAATPGQVMLFRVFAVNALGSSAPSLERGVTIPFQQASAPQNFTATLEAGRVRLNWDAPTFVGGSTVSRYVLSMSVDGGSWRAVINYPAAERTALFVPTTPGKTVAFRLNAETVGAGAGQASPEISVAIPATVPGDPSTITGQMRPGEGVQLNWTAPSNDGGSPILEYRVELFSPNGWIVLTRTSQLSFLAPLGNPGESMLHRVVAVNQVGSSVGSRNFLTKMGTAPATAPLSFSATIVNGSVVLSWAAPAIMGGIFSSYEIQQLEGGVFKRVVSTRGLTVTRVAPAPGQTATYRVVANTNAGTGAFSTAEVTAPKVVPGAPQVNSYGSVGLVNTFTWRLGASNTGGGTLDKARLYREVAGQWVLVAEASAAAGAMTFANELFGQSHRYAMRFTNEIGESSNSSIFTMRHATVVAASATQLAATAQGNALSLTWTNPTFTGGATPTSVEIQTSTDGVNWVRHSTARFVTTAQVSLPGKGRSMSYRVVVINAAGRSMPSESVTFANPLTAPIGAIGVSSRKTSADKVTFTITAPADFGGYSELSLRIERQGTLAWLSSDEFKLTRPLGQAIVTVALPTARGTYTYRVVVSNGSGELERLVTFTH